MSYLQKYVQQLRPRTENYIPPVEKVQNYISEEMTPEAEIQRAIELAELMDAKVASIDAKTVYKEDNKNNSALSVSSRYLSLFPNFIIGTYYPNQIGVYLNIPIGPGITSQKRIIYSTEGKSMSKEEIDITKKIWWSVHKEDHEMCERLQEGRSSPASNDGGLLSPYWEKGVRKFQQLIIQATMKSKKTMKGKKNV